MSNTVIIFISWASALASLVTLAGYFTSAHWLETHCTESPESNKSIHILLLVGYAPIFGMELFMGHMLIRRWEADPRTGGAVPGPILMALCRMVALYGSIVPVAALTATIYYIIVCSTTCVNREE